MTSTRNVPAFDDLPVAADTANMREGVNLSDALLALLPLVGVWRVEGHGAYAACLAEHGVPTPPAGPVAPPGVDAQTWAQWQACADKAPGPAG